ncbi:hypothetical protein PABG_06948 [Paracoccidioides brasiliensis Pb03]|nr:hypothetical protein PABG_06948 [Paracoccidioides brasiliensis Pb03]
MALSAIAERPQQRGCILTLCITLGPSMPARNRLLRHCSACPTAIASPWFDVGNLCIYNRSEQLPRVLPSSQLVTAAETHVRAFLQTVPTRNLTPSLSRPGFRAAVAVLP